MKCPKCGGKLRVSYALPYEDQFYRRKKCENCGRMFWTVEYIVEKNEALKKDISEAWKIRRGEK